MTLEDLYTVLVFCFAFLLVCFAQGLFERREHRLNERFFGSATPTRLAPRLVGRRMAK